MQFLERSRSGLRTVLHFNGEKEQFVFFVGHIVTCEVCEARCGPLGRGWGLGWTGTVKVLTKILLHSLLFTVFTPEQ